MWLVVRTQEDYPTVSPTANPADSSKVTTFSMRLEDDMNFLGTEMATIVKAAKVLGKGLAALGALVALMSFLSFAVLMDLVVTA